MATNDHVPQAEISVEDKEIRIASHSNLSFPTLDAQQPCWPGASHRNCILGRYAPQSDSSPYRLKKRDRATGQPSAPTSTGRKPLRMDRNSESAAFIIAGWATRHR